jgi:hypothetical protein
LCGPPPKESPFALEILGMAGGCGLRLMGKIKKKQGVGPNGTVNLF